MLAWQASVKTQREALHQLAQSFEAFYGSWGRVHEFSVQTRLWATERKLVNADYLIVLPESLSFPPYIRSPA